MNKPKINVLERATTHYKSAISGNLKSITVPEWDCDIYFRQTTNLRSEAEVVELTRQGKSVEALVMSLINKACDEEGNRLFTKYDKDTLMNEVDPNVLLRITSEINNGPMPSVEEIEKN